MALAATPAPAACFQIASSMMYITLNIQVQSCCCCCVCVCVCVCLFVCVDVLRVSLAPLSCCTMFFSLGTPAAIECRAPTSLATVHCPAAVPNANDVREWRRTDTSASTSWITPFSRDDGVYAHESTMVIDSVAHRHAGEYEAWSYRQPGVKAKLICRVYLIVAECKSTVE